MAPETVRTENGERNPSSSNGTRHHLMGTELVSIPVKIESKRLYVSLRENERGRFLKISEAETSSGQRHKMIVPASGIAQLKELVSRVAAEDQRLGASQTNKPESLPDSSSQRGPPKPLYTERMMVSGRRFFLDLLVNSRGRYFKLSHVPLSGNRVQITLPASGLSTFANTIQKVIDEAPGRDGKGGTGDGRATKYGSVKELLVENKRLIFQTGTNNRGSYLRLTEKPGNSAVVMPIDCLPDVVDVLLEISGARDDDEDDEDDENEEEEESTSRKEVSVGSGDTKKTH